MANLDELFSEDNKPESNYFKFSKVGDRIGGTFLGFRDNPEKDGFAAQRVYEIKDDEGKIWKVGIRLDRDYVISRANTAQLGDILGFQYMKDIPASKKGYAPAKSIEVFVQHVAKPIDEPFES